MAGMSTLPHPVRYTFKEYVELEKFSNIKHEYLDGQIYAMAGGTAEHSPLCNAGSTLLTTQTRGRCNTFNSDLQVRSSSNLTTYPDVTVVCGPSERDAISRDVITNPTLIVEVLSNSTEAYDRGAKFEHYKSIGTLQQYVLVSQDEQVVEVWTRGEATAWT